MTPATYMYMKFWYKLTTEMRATESSVSSIIFSTAARQPNGSAYTSSLQVNTAGKTRIILGV